MKLTQKLQREIDRFNKYHPVGCAVRYWPISEQRGTPIETTTRSEAYATGHHTAVVLLVGISGAVACSHVELLDANPTTLFRPEPAA